MRKADETYGLIAGGDRIAVGVSGGKDSLVLLKALAAYRMYIKKDFELLSLTADLGFDGFDTSGIEAFASSLGIRHRTVKTDIGRIVFDIRKESNPCALCAKMRKGALYTAAIEEGCNKAAFAHHVDDAIETFFMSMMYEGRMNTLSPKSYLSRTGITLIRPLILAREHDIEKLANKESMPICKNPCPASGYTKRQEAKEEMLRLYALRPGAKESVERAVVTGLMGRNITEETEDRE